jgi:hypothetical protein
MDDLRQGYGETKKRKIKRGGELRTPPIFPCKHRQKSLCRLCVCMQGALVCCYKVVVADRHTVCEFNPARQPC